MSSYRIVTREMRQAFNRPSGLRRLLCQVAYPNGLNISELVQAADCLGAFHAALVEFFVERRFLDLAEREHQEGQLLAFLHTVAFNVRLKMGLADINLGIEAFRDRRDQAP